MLRDLWNAIVTVIFGSRAVENTSDWYESHKKANQSRKEVDAIIEADKNKKG